MRRKDMSTKFIKSCLAESFVKLLYEKSYSDISVTDICKKAGFGRTTYYRHFSNQKEELLDYFSESRFTEYRNMNETLFKENQDLAILTHIYNNRQFFICLKKQGLFYYVYKMLHQMLFCNNPNDTSGMRYINGIRSGWFFGVIDTWIEDEFNITPKEVLSVTADALVVLLTQSSQTN
jgi:AcrR family transcriptional regulator